MSKIYIKLSLIVLFSYPAITEGCVTDQWTRYQHDNTNSGYNPCVTNITPANVATLHEIGSFMGNAVQGSVVVSNGVAYFGDQGGILYAKNLDLSADVYAPVTTTGGYPINNTVLVTDDTIYVSNGQPASPTNPYPVLFAFNLDLTPKTSFGGTGSVVIDPTVNPLTADTFGSPVLAGNVVVIATAGTDSETNINPDYHGSISAFNIADGSLAWRITVSPAPLTSGGSFSTAAVDSNLNMLFIGTSNANSLPTNNLTEALLAINYLTGDIVWSYQYQKNDAWGALYPEGLDGDVGASPNLFQVRRVVALTGFGVITELVDAVGAASKLGVYRVFERATGNLIWESNILLPTDTFCQTAAPGSAFIPGASAFEQGTIYAPSLANNTGLRLNVLSILSANGNVDAAIAGGTATFGTTLTRIAAFDANTGALKWRDTSNPVTSASLTAANGMVFHNNWGGQLRVLDGDTGAVLTTITVASPVGLTSILPGPISITQGNVYVSIGIENFGGGVKVYSV